MKNKEIDSVDGGTVVSNVENSISPSFFCFHSDKIFHSAYEYQRPFFVRHAFHTNKCKLQQKKRNWVKRPLKCRSSMSFLRNCAHQVSSKS